MRIETVFGGIAVIALLAIGGFAMTGGRAPARAASAPAASLEPTADLCGCYLAAADQAARNPDVTGPAYEGGYGACRESAGVQGGRAWTAGWAFGVGDRSARMACRR